MIDELENGPWPSFISGIKRLRDTHPEKRINEMQEEAKKLNDEYEAYKLTDEYKKDMEKLKKEREKENEE